MSCPDRSDVSRQDGNDLLLEIQIQSRASKNEICHLADGSVKIRITSAPVGGKANMQLRLKIAKIASRLSVATSQEKNVYKSRN